MTIALRCLVLALNVVALTAQDQQPLRLAFGPDGLSSVTWRGHELVADGAVAAGWNDRVFFRDGDGTVTEQPLTDARITVDAEAALVRRDFTWGWVRCDYRVEGERLAFDVTIANTGVAIIDAAHLQLIELALPGAMREYDGTTPRMATNTGEPTIIVATFPGGRLALCNDDIDRPLALGFPVANDRPANTRFPIYVDTGRRGWLPDSMAAIDRPLHPGCTDRYHISLRFGDEVASTADLAGDVIDRYRVAHPPTLAWPDRRPIGTLHLSSTVPHPPANPRGWLGNDAAIDTTTEVGRADLATRLNAHVDATVAELARVGAQGVIIWDIEGQEQPHATSYIGDPRQLPPEMEPLADALFARLAAASLRTGICIRPQLPVRGAYADEVRQVEVPAHDVARVLNEKIAYARARWDCTLFYVDSNVAEPGWRIMDDGIFRAVAAANPDVLLIPEHETCAYWATTAPYHELRQGWTGTPDAVRAIYPEAFSVVYVADGDTAGHRADLIAAVARGDVLLFRGWWPDPFNDDVIAILREAQR